MMRALDLLIMTVPRYAAPEVLPNGDIIIRRLDPQESEDEPIETNGAGIEAYSLRRASRPAPFARTEISRSMALPAARLTASPSRPRTSSTSPAA